MSRNLAAKTQRWRTVYRFVSDWRLDVLPDAIILAVCATIQGLCQLALKAMDGQTPEQRKIIADWFIKDVENWRKFWGIDKIPEKPEPK